MLKLTKKADYGLIALKHLAVNARRDATNRDSTNRDSTNLGVASAKEIADAYRVPLPLLAKILQQLNRAGLVRSEQGTRGGYKLARDPRDISTLEVIRAIDGPIILTECLTPDHANCDLHESCNVRRPLQKLHEGILNLLASISIWDLSQDEPAPGHVLISTGSLFLDPSRTGLTK